MRLQYVLTDRQTLAQAGKTVQSRWIRYKYPGIKKARSEGAAIIFATPTELRTVCLMVGLYLSGQPYFIQPVSWEVIFRWPSYG
jgi:hypothetical protein